LPKIQGLIETDENDTDISYKLNSGDTYFKRSASYLWTPQLSIYRTERIPQNIHEVLDQEINSEETEANCGIIAEINLAFVVEDSTLHYWTIGQVKQMPKSLELLEDIISVGLAKPPNGFFSSVKWDHMLVIGFQQKLEWFEVHFSKKIEECPTIELKPHIFETKWEDVEHKRLVCTSNSRIFAGCNDATLNEVKFTIQKPWLFSREIKKWVKTEECSNKNWLLKLIPKIFFSSSKNIVKIDIDDERHIIYVLSRGDYDETSKISPCDIDIYYLGAYGEALKKVTTISQNDLETQYKKIKNSDNYWLQIVGLHHMHVSESSNINFMLVNSIGQRIYIELATKEINQEKLDQIDNDDYTMLFNHMPVGGWKIVSVVNPPVSKDISEELTYGLSWYDRINYDHERLFVESSYYSKGCLCLSSVSRNEEDRFLLIINDNEAMFKDTNDHSHKGSTEKFWVMKIGHRKAIVDVQTKPLELYIDEDVLNIIGYNSKRIKCDGRRPTKVRHNEYSYNKRHIYSEQIFLSSEQYIIMNNHEIYTMLKVSQNPQF
jgi:hypothetical protein